LTESATTGDVHMEMYRRWHQLAAPYFRWQFEQFEPFVGDRVADVGCGPGNLTEFLRDREAYLGIDRDPAMLAALRDEYGDSPAVTTAQADVLDPHLSEILLEHRTDTVLCLNLLEHLEDDVSALGHLVDGLPPGGIMGVLVPAGPGLYGTLDALDDHVRRYRRSGLLALLSTQPLEIVKFRSFNMVGALGWWWQGKVRKIPEHQDGNYTLMNRLIPLLKPLERLVPPPFGLSLIAVARKV
jgi:SAM-dependent methyltransferase